MLRPEFEELPFYDRPDLTPYVIHLTKNTRAEDNYSAFDNLVNILMQGLIWGSNKDKGFIKGPHSATCFMDVPFISLKYILNKDNCDPDHPRYEPFGIFVTKKYAYNQNCRPVLYLSNNEIKQLQIPEDELWRVVRFEVDDQGWISWLHEREWRCKGDFIIPERDVGVLVRSVFHASWLQSKVNKNPKKFRTKPRSIIPLDVLCQGLPKF